MKTLQEELEKILQREIAERKLTGRKASTLARRILKETMPTATRALQRAVIAEGKKEVLRQRREFTAFERRNFRRWRRAFGELELLVAAAEDVGNTFNREYRPEAAANGDVLFEALVYLHARAILIAREALCLLRGGFPDGAHARWRSLHEAAVTALFVAKHGPAVAERYILSFRAQAHRAMRQYPQHVRRSRMAPFSQSELDRGKAISDAVVAVHGEEMLSDYGWAALALKNKRPTFAAIEESLSLDHWRPRYKWASQVAHSNYMPPHTLLAMAESKMEALVVGPSNSGFVDPASQIAVSLMQITSALLMSKPTIDHVVVFKVLSHMVKKTENALVRVEKDSYRRAMRKVRGPARRRTTTR